MSGAEGLHPEERRGARAQPASLTGERERALRSEVAEPMERAFTREEAARLAALPESGER